MKMLLAGSLGIGLIIGVLARNLTWMDSLSTCTLDDLNDIRTHKAFPRSWIGRYYAATKWVEYIGCRYIVNPPVNMTSYPIGNIFPGNCFKNCENYDYIAFKSEECICLSDRLGLQEVHPRECILNCRGIPCTLSVTKDNLALFANLKETGLPNILHSDDQSLHCSVVFTEKFTNYTSIRAANCDKKNYVVCKDNSLLLNGTQFNYDRAIQKCDLISYNNAIHRTEQYFTNLRRFLVQTRIERNSSNFTDFLGKMRGLKNTHCLSAGKASEHHKISTLPLPCDNRLPGMCVQEEGNSSDYFGNDEQSNSTSNITTKSSASTPVEQPMQREHVQERGRINDIFVWHIVFAVCLSIAVIFAASLSICRFKVKTNKMILSHVEQEPNDIDVTDEKEQSFRSTLCLATLEERKPLKTFQPSIQRSKAEKKYDNDNKETDNGCPFPKLNSDTRNEGAKTSISKSDKQIEIAEDIYEEAWDSKFSKVGNFVSSIKKNVIRGASSIRKSYIAFTQQRPNLESRKHRQQRQFSETDEAAYMETDVVKKDFTYDVPVSKLLAEVHYT